MFYTLSRHGYEFVKTKIQKLNRIAEKLNQPKILFELIKSEMETDPKTMITQKKYYIMCIGEAPVLKDWKFVCTLDFTPKGNIYETCDCDDAKKKAEIEAAIPKRFRTTPFTLCEDCGVERYRTSVFVLHNEKKDKWMQVGSTCLGSFLGVNESEVHQLADFATTLASMPNAMKKWDAKTKNSNKNNSYSGYKIEDLFANLFAYARMAYEKSYNNYVLYSIGERAFGSFVYSPLTFWKMAKPADFTNAESLLKYFRTGEYNPSWKNLFIDNMLVALKNDLIAKKHYKFVKKAFCIYMRNFYRTLYPTLTPPAPKPVAPIAPALVPQTHAVTQIVLPQSNAATLYIGEVGKVNELNLDTVVVEAVKAVTGTTIKLRTEKSVISWACPYKYYVGDKITIKTANVIKHEMVNNECFTFINNATFTKKWK